MLPGSWHAAPMNAHPKLAPVPLYDTDFAAWAERQAKLLREARFGELDIANISEEIEALGRSDRFAIASHLEVLLTHLLKWKYQPEARSTSWQGSIRNARRSIERLIADSPSLRVVPLQKYTAAFIDAREIAALETGLPLSTFPIDCPFSVEEVLSLTFLPD